MKEQDFIDQRQKSASDARAIGTIEDLILADQDADPTYAEAVTLEEQAQFDDFVTRALAFISDTSQQDESVPSPSDAVIKMLNRPNVSIGRAVGEAASEITFVIHNNAKRQGVAYSPDVLFHGADELIAALYVMGNVAGLYEGVPRLDAEKGLADHEWTDQESDILNEAKMVAVNHFGNKMVQTGQITKKHRKEALAFWNDQIRREIEKGVVGEEILEKIDPDAVRELMTTRMNTAPAEDDELEEEPGLIPLGGDDAKLA